MKELLERGRLVNNVEWFETLRKTFCDFLLHPAWINLCAFLGALWYALVSAAPVAYHVMVCTAFLAVVLDAVMAQYVALRAHTWTRKKTLDWAMKLVGYVAIVCSFGLVGINIDAMQNNSTFSWTFMLSAFALINIFGKEVLSLLEHCNTALGGGFDRLLTVLTVAVRWLLRMSEPELPMGEDDEPRSEAGSVPGDGADGEAPAPPGVG